MTGMTYAGYEAVLFYLALFSASIVIGVKSLGVIVHTPEMRRLSVLTSGFEGSMESAFQINTFLNSWLVGALPSGILIWIGPCVSLIMVSKVGAESSLLFGDKTFEEQPIKKKLFKMAKHIPFILFTVLFRMGTWAILDVWKPDLKVFLIVLNWIPIIVLCLIKPWTSFLKNISVISILLNFLNSIPMPAVWYGLSPENIRKMNFFVYVCFIIGYIPLLIMIMCDTTMNPFMRSYSYFMFCCGCISFILLIVHTYKKEISCKLKTVIGTTEIETTPIKTTSTGSAAIEANAIETKAIETKAMQTRETKTKAMEITASETTALETITIETTAIRTAEIKTKAMESILMESMYEFRYV